MRVLFVCLVCAGVGLAQDLTSQFDLPDPSLAVSLWAESPDLYNPTAIDVDARGRIWVTEAVNYRAWGGRNPGRRHDEGDRVVILEDTDGDGRCDRSKVFAQERDLVSPLGICVLGSHIYVSCSPHIIHYVDADGDDVPESREVWLTGFGGHDHDHGVHSVVPGPDGKLYIAVGNAGPHRVTDRSGWTLNSGSLYSGGGEHVAPNEPGLKSSDGRIWTGGLVLRVDPDGSNLEVLGHNFRNNYEVAVDSLGQMWASDNDDDGNQGCRVTWVLPGGNYGFFSADGSRTWQADRRPGQSTAVAHWHQDDPGVVPPSAIMGAGGPTGVCVYEGGILPESLVGAVLHADAGRNVVYAHRPTNLGAGFGLEDGFLLRARLGAGAEESQRWFRPSDVAIGTDGAAYVADWYDPGVGGHMARDRRAYGRILRVAPKGAPTGSPTFRFQDVQDGLVAVGSHAVSVRWQGAQLLEQLSRGLEPEERDGDLVLAFHAAMAETSADAAGLRETFRLLFALQRCVGVPRGELMPDDLLGDSGLDPVAIRAILGASVTAAPKSSLDDEASKAAAMAANSDSPSTRLRGLAIARRRPPVERIALLEPYVLACPPQDRLYVEALGLVADGLESEVWDRVVAAAESGRISREVQRDLAFRLHPESAVPFLRGEAEDGALPLATRRAMVDALGFVPARSAAEAMAHLALAGPPDLRELARHWIERRDQDLWRDYGLAKELPGTGGFEDAVKIWSSGLMRRGAREVDLALRDVESLWLVVTDGGDGEGYDWAAWVEPRLSDGRRVQSLCELPWISAESGWGQTHVGKNPAGGPIVVDGTPRPVGIGTHAPSRVGYRLPPGNWTGFRSILGLDDGGLSQPGSRSSVVFEVWAVQRKDRSWIQGARELVQNPGAPMGDRSEAVKRLGADREGGLALITLADQGHVTPDIKERVAEALRTNPDLTIRAMASGRFPRISSSGVALLPVAELVRMNGDARRGQEVFFGTQAQCSKCHTYGGRGGQVGPDLTVVREKYGPEALYDAILNPSAGIALGYDSWIVATEDDELFSGFILADGDVVVLKDSDGRRHAIPRDKIVLRRRESVSVMPDNVAMGLDAQQLADLVAFLREDRTNPQASPTVDLFNGRDLTGWTVFPSPAVGAPAVWSVLEGGVLRCEGNPAGYIRTTDDHTNFVLELEWRFPGKPGNSGVLLRVVGPDQVWPKSMEAQLMSRNAGDIWNIGAFDMEVDPTRTEGRRTQKLLPTNEKAIGEWNQYRITLFGGNLTLEVNGEIQNVAHWCEEIPGKIGLQSEGAAIEFRNIRLTPLRR